MVRVVGGPNSDPDNAHYYDHFFLEFKLMYFPVKIKILDKKLFKIFIGSCKTFAICFIFRASEMT